MRIASSPPRSGAVIRNGDLALCQGEWTLQRVDPAGAASEIVGRSVEVLRRQPDGTWCYLIDDPFAGEERAAR